VKVHAGDGRSLNVVEFTAPRGLGPPLHRHDDEDELFVVLRGEVAFHTGDDRFLTSEGGLAFLPQWIDNARPEVCQADMASCDTYLRAMALLCIDAMNVIGSRPDGWWRDRDAAVRRFVDELQHCAAEIPATVLVVIDGRPIAGLQQGDHGAVEVSYAPRPGRDAADDRIVEIVGATDHLDVEVVTADRDLRHRVGALGATTRGPRDLLDRLRSQREAAPPV